MKALVVDLVMPCMNGREMCGEIRRVRKGVPVLFISGYPDDIVLDEGEGEGRTAYLRKPIRPTKLLGTVDEIIESADPHPPEGTPQL